MQRGQYAQAVRLLEKMAALTASEAVGFANWARAEIPRVKAIPKKMRDGVPTIIETAKSLIKKHDYGQAAELLQQIPSHMQTAQSQKLLDKSVELQDEADLLSTSLRDCVRRRQFNGIEDNLKRLLQIKPGNRFARDLWESLQTYSKVSYKERDYKLDNKGQLLPHDEGIGNAVMVAIASGVFIFGLMLWGATIYLKSGNETLAVSIDEELLKNGEITLTFDGKEYVIDGPEFKLIVVAGEYGYEIRQGNTVIVNAENFTVVKGGRNVLEIERSSSLPPSRSSAVTTKNVISVKSVHHLAISADQVQDGLAFGPSGTDLFVDFRRTNPNEKHSVRRISLLGNQNSQSYGVTSADLDINSDKTLIAIARHAGQIELRDTSTMSPFKNLQCFDKSGQFIAVCFSPNGAYVAGVTYANLVAVWAGQSHELRLIFPRESSPRPLDSIPPSSVSPAGSLSPSCFS